MSAAGSSPKRWTDEALELRIRSLEHAIEQWAVERDLWFDCSCKSHLAHNGGEPGSPPIATVLCLGGDLYGVLSGEDAEGHEPSFSEMINGLGFEYENNDGPRSTSIRPTRNWRQRWKTTSTGSGSAA